jgi:hypothetical protein
MIGKLFKTQNKESNRTKFSDDGIILVTGVHGQMVHYKYLFFNGKPYKDSNFNRYEQQLDYLLENTTELTELEKALI